ncbi:hypothetical protein WR25_12154 [Diploscapter pachys]|uniref:Uncharacterized protein n=1 Tax=Diploscapter pachys TaxID=2018661 RepID=A0A2A2K6I9_9BILA|nr:hypothetical protein WR25_12154 [Diploscapter pachys]
MLASSSISIGSLPERESAWTTSYAPSSRKASTSAAPMPPLAPMTTALVPFALIGRSATGPRHQPARLLRVEADEAVAFAEIDRDDADAGGQAPGDRRPIFLAGETSPAKANIAGRSGASGKSRKRSAFSFASAGEIFINSDRRFCVRCDAAAASVAASEPKRGRVEPKSGSGVS